MKTKAYAVYDIKAKFFNKPMYLRNAAEALRAFEEEANNPQSQLNKFAADFTLFEIGEYDDETGILTHELAHVSLGNAIQFVKAQNIQNVTQISQ